MSETREARLERIAATTAVFITAGWTYRWEGSAEEPCTRLTTPPSTGAYIPSKPERVVLMGGKRVLQRDHRTPAPPPVIKGAEK